MKRLFLFIIALGLSKSLMGAMPPGYDKNGWIPMGEPYVRNGELLGYDRFKPDLWRKFAAAAQSGRSEFEQSFVDDTLSIEFDCAPEPRVHRQLLYDRMQIIDLKNRELTQDERSSLWVFATERDATGGTSARLAAIRPRKTTVFNAEYIDGYSRATPLKFQDMGIMAIASVPALSVITLASIATLSAVLIRKVSQKKARHNATKVEAALQH